MRSLRPQRLLFVQIRAGEAVTATRGEASASVLDACCGTRSMWYDRADGRALFLDNRRESLAVDVGTPGTIGRSAIVIDPNVVADFTALPFADESFHLVVFDPPHVQRHEALGAVTRRYGVLNGDWRQMLQLRRGLGEAHREAHRRCSDTADRQHDPVVREGDQPSGRHRWNHRLHVRRRRHGACEILGARRAPASLAQQGPRADAGRRGEREARRRSQPGDPDYPGRRR